MTFSGMKNALIFLCIFHGKWVPKWSQNRCQNRLVTILGGPRAARDPLWMFSGRQRTEKGCSKIDAKKMMRNLEQNKPNLCDRRAGFGAGGEVRRGQAPPGPAISGSDSASQSNTPCTRRGAAEKASKNRCRKLMESWCQKGNKMRPKWSPESIVFV